MDIKELMKAVLPMPAVGAPVAPMAAPVPQMAPAVSKKLGMDTGLLVEAQKVFQPGAEHKQGSPAPKPQSKGTASKMEPSGWSKDKSE